MSLPQVAIKYAQAARELAQDPGDLEGLDQDMALLGQLMTEVPALAATCKDSPRGDQIHQVLKAQVLPAMSPPGARLLALILDSRRQALLPFLPKAWEELRRATRNTLEALVESASPLEPGQLENIRTLAMERWGKNIEIKTHIRPGLLGGLRLIAQDRVLDLSLAGRLADFRHHMAAKSPGR